MVNISFPAALPANPPNITILISGATFPGFHEALTDIDGGGE